MQIEIFEIPAFDTSGALEEMNRFLRGHKILNVEQQLVQNRNSSYWSFCIKYLESETGGNFVKNEKKTTKTNLMK